MLLDFLELNKKYNFNITGVLHIGAHTGEEYPLYLTLKIPRIIFFEPIPLCYSNLCNYIANINKINGHLELPEITCHQYALGNINDTLPINISKHDTVASVYGASSSLLKPKKHLEQHPAISFEDTLDVEVHRLDDLNGGIKQCNFINIDVQGYELEVFKGASKTLNNIDYIVTEVNIDEVYEDCAKMYELDDFLRAYNFERVETCMGGGLWGDALYIKKEKSVV